MLAGKVVILQQGHKNVALNPDPALRGSTGAAGELEWSEQFCDQLQARLEAAGATIKRVDGSGQYGDLSADLAYCPHYDGGAPEESACFVARGADDQVGALSDKAVQIWCEVVPGMVGIPLDQSRVTVNMTYYYFWSYLPGPVPAILAEHGNGPNDHDHDSLINRLADHVAAAEQVIVRFIQEGR
ncbi:MAG: hypothetical protein KGJ86_00190 [Chloroflexota bacterium]|nr:hypothetical protein [Chloroflexota bacterium]